MKLQLMINVVIKFQLVGHIAFIMYSNRIIWMEWWLAV